MANKYRPKGSYKKLLKLTSKDISELSESQLRGIVNKLNDTANKRIKRIKESGYEELSSAYRTISGKRFKGSESASFDDLKVSYMNVKNFLTAKTSSLGGTKRYINKFEIPYENILGKPLDDPSNYDKRFKSKKVLKKSVKNKIRDFWESYDQWREIEIKNNPNSQVGDTNLENVQKFEEEIYSKGETNLSDMERKAKEDYLKDEANMRNKNEGNNGLSPSTTQRRGKANIKQNKYKGKGIKYGKKIKTEGISEEFEEVSIFDDF